ncbi:esterase-like activity of phytase family protein [Antrihabitans cavernicola]|uniref:Esterase-like activity of phytase family protein n=2 Tax=Antrihabitans cavernicola TaxID=2495913 RepID=A0A5A7S9E9_9NOCA|nr:esterase-like activity of phytase family protein [Spelaeibacter cavernicola]
MGSKRVGAVVAVAVLAALAGCSDDSSNTEKPKDSAFALTAKDGQATTFGSGDLLRGTDATAVVGVSDPKNGKIAVAADGSYSYTPNPGFTGTDTFTYNTTDAVHNYTTSIPPLGEVGGVKISGSGYGSSWTPAPGVAGEYFGLTDRGPNVDGVQDNQKVEPIPSFTPAIGRFKLADGKAELLQSIPLKAADGSPLNGQVSTEASTGETIVDINGAVLPPSPNGYDPEGVVALADGTFWVSDEYGPYITHFGADGRATERLSPFDATLPGELKLRTPNQGMEGLTITPDGKKLVGIMQSALKTPGLDGSAKSVPFARIVTVDLASKKTAEFLYPLDNPKKTKVANSEITALSNTTFVVDERDGEFEPGADKKLWTIDITGATDVGPQSTVAGARYDAGAGGLLVGDKPLETLVGPTDTDGAVKTLQDSGITTVRKTSSLDLGGLLTSLNKDGKFFGHDKVEGVAAIDNGTKFVISNDNDFGIVGVTNKQPPFTLKEKDLPNGTQDAGEILIVDTTKLPAKVTEHTASVEVK